MPSDVLTLVQAGLLPYSVRRYLALPCLNRHYLFGLTRIVRLRFICVAEAQSFDGPAPETINGRLAMLGITSALGAEFVTGVGLREQWLEAPAPILFSFAIIAIASYIPILKGFTRYVVPTGNMHDSQTPRLIFLMNIPHMYSC